MSLISISNFLLSLVFAATACTFWRAGRYLLQQYYLSSLRFVPGPPSPGFLYGNLSEIFAGDRPAIHHAWSSKYGHVLKYRGMFNMERLLTTDLRAVNYILTHSTEYHKPEKSRVMIAQIVGEGMLWAEDEQHRRQRRIMNPAFGPGQIRDLTGAFVEKAAQLRDAWSTAIGNASQTAKINIFDDLTRTTLDIIGLAGFEYHFDALQEASQTSAELRAAFRTMYSIDPSIAVMRALQLTFPPLYLVPHAGLKRLDEARRVMERVSRQLVMEKKRVIMRNIGKDVILEKSDVLERDILTLLLKANLATDLPEDARLTDEEVIAQIPTLLVAGHETTSIAASWCLYSLAKHPEIQRKLREELLQSPTEEPSMDELNALPYLDAVVRETLRFHSPVPFTLREATNDDFIPLSTPYTDVRGEVHDSIKIDKGTTILVPIAALNTSRELWGDDAAEFKPTRWESPPEIISALPGVWGNMLTFLGGPRACIGYRFSIVELKALIFVLVRVFEFEPAEEITTIANMISLKRPVVANEKENGNQLPLLVKRYSEHA
ncbi:hypothetical protein CERSUDRAFT_117989 [Gelatoporia subvermispora B]|uniref:Cytochrome P450 n=1 Tax=Ceriporiopsis subvermispora (strain B) TaxID=914234 RepID=M2R393_CERS8|nr:hypothetical protein CERSUDRAFT_117989 [Gelatoporia subvermispora B]